MKVQQFENKTKMDVTKLKGLKVLFNGTAYKPKPLAMLFGAGNEILTTVEDLAEKVYFIEFLMPNNAFLHRIECAVGKEESAIDKMLDIYNRHKKLILEV